MVRHNVPPCIGSDEIPIEKMFTIWLFKSSPWKITIFDRSTIYKWVIFHGYVSHNQRVNPWFAAKKIALLPVISSSKPWNEIYAAASAASSRNSMWNPSGFVHVLADSSHKTRTWPNSTFISNVFLVPFFLPCELQTINQHRGSVQKCPHSSRRHKPRHLTDIISLDKAR